VTLVASTSTVTITEESAAVSFENSSLNTLVLVNSERTVWLGVTGLNNKKPDFHIVHWAFHAPATPHNLTTCFFGGLSDPIFTQQVNFIFEGKIVNLANFEIGIMINYLSRQGVDNPMPRGLLYNQSEWMYFRNEGSLVVECVAGKWTDAGSFNFLSHRIQTAPLSDLTEAVIALSKALNVSFEDHEGKGSFLGRGADGYVFKVKDLHSSSVFAMKIVLHDNIADEYLLIKGAAALVPHLVVDVVGNYVNTILKSGKAAGAFLLESVGKRVNQKSRTSIVKALVALHDKNILHGDPRIDNILLVDGNFCWIDFRKSRFGFSATSTAKSNDLKICIMSLFHSNFTESIASWCQGRFHDQFIEYGLHPTEELALALLKQVTVGVQTNPTRLI
jgi:hypothetical protein